MATEPDIGVRVEFGDVPVELRGGLVVVVLSSQGFDEAGLVAGEGGGRTVTDLFPEVVAPLGAAAAEEEVIIDFVLCGGAGPIEDCG